MAGLVFEHYTQSSAAENVGTGIKDPLRNLVYRVHPLPESMIDHIFDFGSLSSDTESLYIKAMLRKQLSDFVAAESTAELLAEEAAAAKSSAASEASGAPQPPRRRNPREDATLAPITYTPLSPFKEFVEVFSELICSAQECIRRLSDGERSSASLRDVSRCVR